MGAGILLRWIDILAGPWERSHTGCRGQGHGVFWEVLNLLETKMLKVVLQSAVFQASDSREIEGCPPIPVFVCLSWGWQLQEPADCSPVWRWFGGGVWNPRLCVYGRGPLSRVSLSKCLSRVFVFLPGLAVWRTRRSLTCLSAMTRSECLRICERSAMAASAPSTMPEMSSQRR